MLEIRKKIKKDMDCILGSKFSRKEIASKALEKKLKFSHRRNETQNHESRRCYGAR
jgi:hypothetical protein